jgi:hypothetical protein
MIGSAHSKMESILFIHGYSAESKKTDFDSVKSIYGDQTAKPNLNLPDALRAALGGEDATVLEMISSYCACRNQKSISFFETDRGVRNGAASKHLIFKGPRSARTKARLASDRFLFSSLGAGNLDSNEVN